MKHLESLHLLARLTALSQQLVGTATTGEWLEQLLAWSLRRPVGEPSTASALGLTSGGLIDLDPGVRWGWGGGVIRGMGDPLDTTPRTAWPSSAGLWVMDPRSENLYWSRSCFAMHDLAHLPDISVAQAQAMVLHGHRNTLLRAVQRAQHTLLPYDVTLPRRTASGREIWVRSIGLPCLTLGDGPPLLVGLLAQLPGQPDETAEAAADEHLRQELWASNDAALVCDAQGQVLFANRRMHSWCGEAQPCLVGQALPTFGGALTPVLAQIHATGQQAHQRTSGHIHLPGRDGQPCPLRYDLRHHASRLGHGGYWVLMLHAQPRTPPVRPASAPAVPRPHPWRMAHRPQLVAALSEAMASQPLRPQIDAVIHLACGLEEQNQAQRWPSALLDLVTQELCKWLTAHGLAAVLSDGRWGVLLRDVAQTEDEAVAFLDRLVARAWVGAQSHAAALGYPPLRTRTTVMLLSGQPSMDDADQGALFRTPSDLDASTVLKMLRMAARTREDEPVLLLRKRWLAVGQRLRLRGDVRTRSERDGVRAHFRLVQTSRASGPPMGVCVAQHPTERAGGGLAPLSQLTSDQVGLPTLRRLDQQLMQALEKAARSARLPGWPAVCWVHLAAADSRALLSLQSLRQSPMRPATEDTGGRAVSWGVCLHGGALPQADLLAAAHRCQALGLPIMLRHSWSSPIPTELWSALQCIWLDAPSTAAWSESPHGRGALQRWVRDAHSSGIAVIADGADVARWCSPEGAMPYLA